MHVYMTVRAALLAVGLAVVFSAPAQALPEPKEFYFDQDKAAVPIAPLQGEGEALTAALVKARDSGRGRRAQEATAQLAHVAYGQGRADLGKALYAQLLGDGGVDRVLKRSVAWNYGWDLYRSADYAGALAQWQAVMADSIGGPSWLPPTLALALWQLGRKDEAVMWYAAAVRTDPLGWGTSAQYGVRLPDWSQDERATLAQVQAAWQANPPAYP